MNKEHRLISYFYSHANRSKPLNNSERLKMIEGKPPKIATGMIQSVPTVALRYISENMNWELQLLGYHSNGMARKSGRLRRK